MAGTEMSEGRCSEPEGYRAEELGGGACDRPAR